MIAFFKSDCGAHAPPNLQTGMRNFFTRDGLHPSMSAADVQESPRPTFGEIERIFAQRLQKTALIMLRKIPLPKPERTGVHWHL